MVHHQRHDGVSGIIGECISNLAALDERKGSFKRIGVGRLRPTGRMRATEVARIFMKKAARLAPGDHNILTPLEKMREEVKRQKGRDVK